MGRSRLAHSRSPYAGPLPITILTPEELYGPAGGAPAIRAGAGANLVSDPGGGIAFNSSSDLQTKINANAAGSLFVCSVANPVWNSNVNCGTKNPTIIFPGNTIVDGGNVAGIKGIDCGTNGATTIKGGTFRNLAAGGITARGACLLEDITLTQCGLLPNGSGAAGVGLLNVAGATLRRLSIHGNGRVGIGNGDFASGSFPQVTIEDCDIYNNNTDRWNPGGEGAGSKILTQIKGIFRRNWVHDNIGFGMWWDTDCYNWDIYDNVAENNERTGLFYEACYGGKLHHNFIYNNGRDTTIGTSAPAFSEVGGVRLSDNAAARVDPDGLVRPVELYRNIIDHDTEFGGQTGCLLVLWDHSDSTSRHVSNNDIYENQFWMRFTKTVGGNIGRIRCWDTVSDSLNGGVFNLFALDNHFWGNEYHVLAGTTGTTWWQWGGVSGALMNYTTWQGFHPDDNKPLVTI